MDIRLLIKYIEENSTEQSRTNSLLLDINGIIKTKNKNFFYYKNSKKNIYKITLSTKNSIVQTRCSCPRENLDPCKHIIFIVNYLSNELDNNKVTESIKSPSNVSIEKNKLFLENGIISKHLIKSNKVTNYSPYFDIVKVLSISRTHIKTVYGSWYNWNQDIEYDPETSILTLNCSCSKKKEICEHLHYALEHITNVFGEDYFSENYLENIQINHLKKYELEITEKNLAIFNFDLTVNGVLIKSKVKNIQLSSQNIFPDLKNEKLITDLRIPFFEANESFQNFGLCFVFSFYKKEFINILPLQAKYNKAKTDFSSGFRAIDYINLDAGLAFFKKKEEQNLILNSIQINDLISRYNTSKELMFLKRAIHYFNEIVPFLQKYILYNYEDRKSLTRKNLSPISILQLPVSLFFTLTESELFFTLKAKLKIGESNYSLGALKFTITDLFIKFENSIIPLQSSEISYYIKQFQSAPEVNYLKNDFNTLYDNVIEPLSKKFEIQSEIFKKQVTINHESKLEKQVYITEQEESLIIFKLVVQYNKQPVDVFSSEMVFNPTAKMDFINHSNIFYEERNTSFENEFIEDFKAIHPEFKFQDKLFFLTPNQLIENHWLFHAIDKMRELEIQVFGANNLQSFKFNSYKPLISTQLKSDIDWFDLEINISFGNQKVTMKELEKAFLKQTNYVVLDDGTLGILPEEWMKKFSNYFKVGEIKSNSVKLSNYQFGIIDELYETIENKPPFLMDLLEKKKRLQNISNIDVIPVPSGIKAKLRDYQRHGLNWLVFLDKHQLGGCLADDMGLGKTLQIITFLQHLKKVKKNLNTSLIIAPTSLVFNWKNEILKFCPTLKTLIFVGSNRARKQLDFQNYDLVISTYGSLLNDLEFMKEFHFNYIVLDESQAIKNPNSKRYKAVRLLNSFNRLVLTGTPIENNTFDLYAQMNFINPGLLGNITHFKKEFSDAIDKEKNQEASNLLSKMIAPFLLRRTKEQVATELPEKTESILYCEMGKEQRKLYDSFKNKYREYLINKIKENGVEKSQMYILDGLTKLRQICNSTQLVKTEEDYGNFSVKMDILIENIKEKTNNHKILIFSQFVRMLQLIKLRLEEENIPFEYLDGKTINREEKVKHFQENKEIRAFLISLKAGGTGLNLTEADYVFIIDPWWNPAVENQAIDRCYRIGQKQKVMAYRMICKDTIEEKIVILNNKKKKLANSIIAIDEEKKAIDLEQVKSFFS